MGGGTRKIEEARRSPKLSPRPLKAGLGAGGVEGAGAARDQELPICEREQQLTFRIADGADLQLGEAIAVVRGMPLAIVARQEVVGSVSDRRQSATLAGCLEAGYAIFGEVTVLDELSGEALAVVSGMKTRE